ncbi:MAG: HdeD family acid-resistance protein [Bradyrhizobiaceae bacterium]|nr:HdeD family acid-resistance protein [Bradyrhizobiaceae bacterium]
MQSSPHIAFPHAAESALHALAKRWWLILLRGLVAIVFGILAFAWPGLTLLTLVLLYGAFAFADGVVALAAAVTGRGSAPTWWLVLVGILGIAAGIVSFMLPGMTALILILLIGAWAIAHGIIEIAAAIQLRKEIRNDWLLVLAGVLSVAFGFLVIAAPGAGALGLVWAIAAYAILFGILLIGFSLQVRRYQHSAAAHT